MRSRDEQYKKYSWVVRRIRQRIFDYPDDTKATRVLHKAMARVAKNMPPKPTDQWGATADDHSNLGRQGISWGD